MKLKVTVTTNDGYELDSAETSFNPEGADTVGMFMGLVKDDEFHPHDAELSFSSIEDLLRTAAARSVGGDMPQAEG